MRSGQDRHDRHDVIGKQAERDGPVGLVTVQAQRGCRTVIGIRACRDGRDGRDGCARGPADDVGPSVARPLEALPVDAQRPQVRRQALEGLGQGPGVLGPLALARDIVAREVGKPA